jgi:glycine cleavage system transcriptional repressor
MTRYIILITARDRPGIVAKVSGVLLEQKGNIEAVSQTVHQGYFTMIILCQVPIKIDQEKVIQHIRERAGHDMHVYVTEYKIEEQKTSTEERTFIVTAEGPDKPGILHTLSNHLASRQINIDDLYACVKDGIFIVICQVSIPAGLDVTMLQLDLEAAGEQGGFIASMQHENIFVATNELALGHYIKDTR